MPAKDHRTLGRLALLGTTIIWGSSFIILKSTLDSLPTLWILAFRFSGAALIMALAGGPVFAFARPVPYNPSRLRHPRRDEVLVALAGPASNLAQAVVGAALLGLLDRSVAWIAATSAGLEVAYWAYAILLSYVRVNLVLCFFNLIPLPPLDGSKVILYFLKGEARQKYYELQNYSMAILLAALYLLPGLLRVDPLGAYLGATAGRLYGILIGAVL